MSFQVFGTAVSRGVAIGRAVLVASSRLDVAHYFVDEAQVPVEVARCHAARDQVAEELTLLRDQLPPDAPAELAALLDVHLMLVRDEALVDAAVDWVRERHYNAEWALSAQLEVLARQFDEMEDEYLRERKADLEQVVERMLSVLARQADPTLGLAPRDFAGEDPLLLVAADISPADLLGFRDGVFKGFITDIGGKTSHTAIVARSMDIPAVVGTREASRLIRQDDWVVIDGDAGAVIVNPSPIVLEEYRFRQRQSELERARLARLRHTPAVTLDGEAVQMHANIELPGDAKAALAAGAEGVGLFRSEFLFMGRGGQLPSEEEQYEAYREAVEAMQGRPVTIRTVDIGADKPLDRAPAGDGRYDHVLNPALGLRAIRWSLSEPAMFRQQLRAIYRASAHGPVRLLLPMVAHMKELRQVRDCITRVRQQLVDNQQPTGQVELGVMIEIPAAALILDALLPLVDFVSIGTNDLIQYTLAIDRADESVAHLYDPWHPAVMQLLATVIGACRARGKGVSVCGEMAGDVAFTDALLAMGLRSFSMHPSQIAFVKQRILRADASKLAAQLPQLLGDEDPERVAKRLGWA
ncbi:phosphoenolpyruvate--protein phosphotransferase [Inhella proteolytica]|uniref:Phosphoenolpyruvate-protein phosphotransferase n=1 Tax=Inhella proteolytica TaxID=2795029 RepID=A0A931NH63_9BURK|nr:phosphoenolpyruvate--protein phosphotransferase [Inhella proteolytica]MBH9577413.1 phosphoenolpyruvate--protein phosphotransferase [Inhella proteolytica]